MRLIFVALLLCACPTAAGAQNHFPLEILAPRAALPTNHRLTLAYTGLTWVGRVAAIGGAWPYTCTLTNPGSGMTVSGVATLGGLSDTSCTMTWVNPTANATPTIQVCDRDNDCVTETWTITVSTDAANWKFVDPVSGNDANAGTLASPWQTLNKVYTSSTDAQCVYFRAGTVNLTGIPTAGTGTELRVNWTSTAASGGSTCWIEYPGEAAILDFQSDGVCASAFARIRFSPATTRNVWVSGLELRNVHVMGLQLNLDQTSTAGVTLYDLYFNRLRCGAPSSNSAFIESISTGAGTLRPYHLIQNVRFYNLEGESSGIKWYSVNKSLTESSEFDTSNTTQTEMFAAKDRVGQFTLRNSVFKNLGSYGIAGNQGDGPGTHLTTGEVAYNNVWDDGGLPACAIQINQQGEAGAIYIYRNTFQGCQYVRNTDAADGPFTWATNVLISTDTNGAAPCPALKAYCETITDYARLVDSGNNLTGVPVDSIVNASGELQGAYVSHVGTRGWQLGAAATSPVRLRFQGDDLLLALALVLWSRRALA